MCNRNEVICDVWRDKSKINYGIIRKNTKKWMKEHIFLDFKHVNLALNENNLTPLSKSIEMEWK